MNRCPSRQEVEGLGNVQCTLLSCHTGACSFPSLYVHGTDPAFESWAKNDAENDARRAAALRSNEAQFTPPQTKDREPIAVGDLLVTDDGTYAGRVMRVVEVDAHTFNSSDICVTPNDGAERIRVHGSFFRKVPKADPDPDKASTDPQEANGPGLIVMTIEGGYESVHCACCGAEQATPHTWRECAERSADVNDRLLKQAENRLDYPRVEDAKLHAYETALTKLNQIRDSIVGMQGFNFSEHAYPMVRALNEAGFTGLPYPEARANLGTLIEQTKAAEDERDGYRSALCDLVAATHEYRTAPEIKTAFDRARATLKDGPCTANPKAADR